MFRFRGQRKDNGEWVKGLEGEKYGIRYSPYIYSFTMHRINREFNLTCHISNIDSSEFTIIGKQGGGNDK